MRLDPHALTPAAVRPNELPYFPLARVGPSTPKLIGPKWLRSIWPKPATLQQRHDPRETGVQSFEGREKLDEVGRFLGSQVGQLSIGHQRGSRRPKLFHVLGREDNISALARPYH
jgi:hypothetical protein